MSEKISWSFKAQVSSGPTSSHSGEITADAYDKIEVEIPAAESVAVEVQPGENVTFLLVTAASYESLVYKVGEGEDIAFDGPHILIGSGAVGLLGSAPNTFTFTNSNDEGTAAIKVSILVGRDATPPPEE